MSTYCSVSNGCPTVRRLLDHCLLVVCLLIVCSAFLIQHVIITRDQSSRSCTINCPQTTIPSSIEDKRSRASMSATDVHVGPWGGTDGVNPWTFIFDGRIRHIRISTGDCIDSIGFTYMDHARVKHHSKIYGGRGGLLQYITFADDEDLIGISGTVGKCAGRPVITSLSFLTNKNEHGPYGRTRGTSFSLPMTKGRFGGFSGNYGDYLDSFGVILYPY